MNEPLDIYYGELTDTLQFINSKVYEINFEIEIYSNRSLSPPEWLCDKGEYYIGLGFAVCQKYIASSCGILKIKKEKALQIGPFHESGIPVVKIINAAANYWKHKDEWDDIVVIPNEDKELLEIAYHYYDNLTVQSKKTIDTIEAVTSWSDYTCSNILASISPDSRLILTGLGELLKKWYCNICNDNPNAI